MFQVSVLPRTMGQLDHRVVPRSDQICPSVARNRVRFCDQSGSVPWAKVTKKKSLVYQGEGGPESMPPPRARLPSVPLSPLTYRASWMALASSMAWTAVLSGDALRSLTREASLWRCSIGKSWIRHSAVAADSGKSTVAQLTGPDAMANGYGW